MSAETTPVDTHDIKAAFAFGQHEESRTTSWEWEIRLTSPPKDLSVYVARPVCLERLFLSSDQDILIGTVAVVNLAFRKHVAARFTFDDWKTASEVSASLCHDRCGKHSHDGYDRFTFDIKLNDQANLERKTMSVCFSYSVNGQKFWDNNNEMNYRVEFVKTAQAGSSRCSRGPRPVLHRSRSFTSSHTTHPRSASMSFDDLPEITSKVTFANSSASATRQPSVRPMTLTPSLPPSPANSLIFRRSPTGMTLGRLYLLPFLPNPQWIEPLWRLMRGLEKWLTRVRENWCCDVFDA